MTRTASNPALPSFRNVMSHQLGVIFLVLLAAVGTSWMYSLNLPLTYTSNAVVLLSPSPGNPLVAEAASGSAMQLTIALETEAQLIHTPAVAAVVSEMIGREVPRENEKLSVAIPSNTQMVTIDFTSSSPGEAQEGAQGFAEGYLLYRQTRSEAVQGESIERLNEQISETDSSLRRAVTEAAGDESASYASQEAQLLADRLARLNNSLSDNQALSTYPGAVIVQADAPVRANGIPRWALMLAAAVVGLLMGMALAFLREWRRDFVRDAEGLESIGLAAFSTIDLRRVQRLGDEAPRAAVESFRELRTQVIASGPRPRVITVSEAGSKIGAEGYGHVAEVAVGLALILSEAKFSTLVIATSSQGPQVEALLGVSASEGLAEATRYPDFAEELVRETAGISLLTAGYDFAHASDVTSSAAFLEIVDALRPQFDYVIIAASAAGSADGDAALLVSDSALLVVSPGVITRRELSKGLSRLDRLGVAVSGGVILRRPKSTKGGATERWPRAENFRKELTEHVFH